MYDRDNPFSPGVGTPPPEIAGREAIIKQVEISIERAKLRRSAQSLIMYGFGGVGKTVLLSHWERDAKSRACLTTFIEAEESKRLAQQLVPRLHSLLRQLSMNHQVDGALRTLKSFVQGIRLEFQGVSIALEPSIGVADSGNLEHDLTDVFVAVAEALLAAEQTWILFIDEMQYLEKEDLAALIGALHKMAQNNYPILLLGAGLPQMLGNSGNAKSYAERRVQFTSIGALDQQASRAAIENPINKEGERITPAALAEIYTQTRGYPYYLQEWGKQVWNGAARSPIGLPDVVVATDNAIAHLDDSFFRVQLDRLTPAEQEYVNAMAELPIAEFYRAKDVADKLGKGLTRLGPVRANIIHKGMIYSPSHGDIAFTVPMFAEYLQRLHKKNP